ncbi:MAG: ABC transporter ATP-binding protein [Coriobacteriia bacterium]
MAAPTPPSEPPAVRVRGLVHVYPDGTRALDGIDLTIEEGESVALLGPNGAGKSTLILHLNGLLRPTEGEVAICGVPVSEENLRAVRSMVGMVFQDPDDQLFMTTVHDDVAFGPLNMGLAPDEVANRVHDALHDVGLAEMASRPAQHLSFGQRKRAALATVLSMNPRLFVLDEPTSNLDPRSRRQMTERLGRLDSTKIVATHDMDVAAALCSRAVILDEGRIAADLPLAEAVADGELLDRHGLEPPCGQLDAGTIRP